MNEDFIKKDIIAAVIKIKELERKLSIAVTGLKAIISYDSDTLKIAQKTLE